MNMEDSASGGSLSTADYYDTIRLMDGREERPDVVLWLEVAAKPWGRLETTPHQLWNVFRGDMVLVSRHRDPEHAACRALLATGVTGEALFVHRSSGMPGMMMNIERAAMFSTIDDDAVGLRTIRYVPFDRDRVMRRRENGVSGASMAKTLIRCSEPVLDDEATDATAIPAAEVL